MEKQVLSSATVIDWRSQIIFRVSDLPAQFQWSILCLVGRKLHSLLGRPVVIATDIAKVYLRGGELHSLDAADSFFGYLSLC